MSQSFLAHLDTELTGLKATGLYKSERVISSMQSAEIEVGGNKVLNFCANNYLGLADSEELRDAAAKALDRYGYGMASVRFICGTQEEHKQLEARISSFLGLEDTILYGSCFDANGGLFETLLGEEDAPVIKVSTRKALSERWHDLIDLDAGRIATGEATIADIGWELFHLILDVASGRKQVCADKLGLHNALALFNPAPVT